MNAPEKIAQLARMIALDELHPSPTNPRSRMKESDLKELADSIAQFGVLQPVLVRPLSIDESSFEIVAGHRRVQAARMAGLEMILATVRELNDEQALEIQLIENIQRKDVHPLDEAYSFMNLTKITGWGVPEICAKVSKSKSYVYQRMALLDLCDEAKEAFYSDQLETSVALLIARIPKVLQKRALKTILNGFMGKPMAYQSAKDIVERQFMLTLSTAPFDTNNADLTAAGSCSACPKRTGANRDLFGDIEADDKCTDPTCFDDKRAAHSLALRERAIARKIDVIEGERAIEIMPTGLYSLDRRYVGLDEDGFVDEEGNSKTYREMLGEKAPVTAIITDNTSAGKGRFIEIADRTAMAQALKKAGLYEQSELQQEDAWMKKSDVDGDEDDQSDENESGIAHKFVRTRISEEEELLYRATLYSAVREAFSKKLGSPEDALEQFREVTKNIFWQMADGFNREDVVKLAELWGVGLASDDENDYGSMTDDQMQPLADKIDTLDATEICLFLLDLAMVPESTDTYWQLSDDGRLIKTAKRLGVDADKIKKEAADTIKKGIKE